MRGRRGPWFSCPPALGTGCMLLNFIMITTKMTAWHCVMIWYLLGYVCNKWSPKSGQKESCSAWRDKSGGWHPFFSQTNIKFLPPNFASKLEMISKILYLRCQAISKAGSHPKTFKWHCVLFMIDDDMTWQWLMWSFMICILVSGHVTVQDSRDNNTKLSVVVSNTHFNTRRSIAAAELHCVATLVSCMHQSRVTETWFLVGAAGKNVLLRV